MSAQPAPHGATVIPIGARARLERVGLGYRCRWDEAGVEVRADRIRESRGELSCELRVSGHRAGAGIAELPLYAGRFSLSSLAARKTAAGYLAARGNGADYAEILEQFCTAVMAEERRGEPFEQVGRAPLRTALEHRLAPLLPLDDPAWLYAPFAVGKTTIAAAAALSVAAGVEVIPGMRPRQCPVLILDWEARHAAWNDRIARIAAGHGVTVPATIHYRRCARALPDQVPEVAAFATEHGVGLVIIDSAGKAIPSAREGVDANEGALQLTRALRAIGGTSLVIDHVRGDQLGTEQAIARPYGSVYKLNEARSAWELRRERDSVPNRADLALIHAKVNDGPRQAPIGLAIEYDGDTGPIRFVRADIEAPELLRALSRPEHMARLLHAGPRSTRDLAEQIGCKESDVRQVLSRHPERFLRLPDGRLALVASDA